MTNQTALIVGASGLVGSYCSNNLLHAVAYNKVISLTRTPFQHMSEKLKNVQVHFDELETHRDQMVADHVYCALGTTIKKAGSNELFRRVDFDYVYNTAKITKELGAKKFILISAIGADPGSMIFYNRIKGEVEVAIKELNFDTFVILRPSIILGERKEKRRGEALAQYIATNFDRFMVGRLENYRGIPAEDIANVMTNMGVNEKSKLRILESEEIRAVADDLR